MSRTDGRCDSLTAKGTRCTRDAAFSHHAFSWCWQHLPQFYKDRQTKEQDHDA